MKTFKIANGVSLNFLEEENSVKFSFSSDNPKLQVWAENCKKKRVKENEIFYVVKAAKDFWHSGAQLAPQANKDFTGDYVSELNHYCQKNGLSASYSSIGQSGSDHAPVFIEEVCVAGKKAQGRGATKKEARRAAAQKYLYPDSKAPEIRRPQPVMNTNIKNARQELKELCDYAGYKMKINFTECDGTFFCFYSIDFQEFQGCGSSKKAAQESAAQEALDALS